MTGASTCGRNGTGRRSPFASRVALCYDDVACHHPGDNTVRPSPLRSALAAAFVAATVAPRAGAEDHVVDLRCVGTGAEAHYEIDPQTITIVAGVDRVLFRTGTYESAIHCTGVTMAPTLAVDRTARA